jgi:hypothetical protein
MNPLWSFYDNTLLKPYMPQGITYDPCLERYGGGVILKDPTTGIFNHVEQNGYLKIWLDLFGEKVGVRGGVVALQSLSIIKKGTSPLNFQSNEPFLKFLRQSFL